MTLQLDKAAQPIYPRDIIWKDRIPLISTWQPQIELFGSTTWTKHNLWFNSSNLYTYNTAILKEVTKQKPISAWNNKNLQAEDIWALDTKITGYEAK